MIAKIVFALVVVIATVYAQEGHGYHNHHHLEEYIDYQAHPHYHYAYSVHDPKHHDIKSQQEHRDGDVTKGSYTLLQPDHRRRIVEYEADKHGVRYNVKYEGHAYHEPVYGHGGHGHHGGVGGGF